MTNSRFMEQVRKLSDPLLGHYRFEFIESWVDELELNSDTKPHVAYDEYVCFARHLLSGKRQKVVMKGHRTNDWYAVYIWAEQDDRNGQLQQIPYCWLAAERFVLVDTFEDQMEGLNVDRQSWDSTWPGRMRDETAALYVSSILVPGLLEQLRSMGCLEDNPTGSETGPTTCIETQVVGVTFEGRQAVVAQLAVNEEVLLCREPQNSYDGNAIRVERKNGRQIGYLSRQLAATLAIRLDNHGDKVPAVVTRLWGGSPSKPARGVEIRFTVPQ